MTWSGGNYYGYFKEGWRNGAGKITYDHGEIQEGQFKKGQRNGYGMRQQPNGIRYYGEWKNNVSNGEAAVLLNEELLGEGIFVNGWMKQNGKHFTLN